jgi:hypothetical protein
VLSFSSGSLIERQGGSPFGVDGELYSPEAHSVIMRVHPGATNVMARSPVLIEKRQPPSNWARITKQLASAFLTGLGWLAGDNASTSRNLKFDDAHVLSV